MYDSHTHHASEIQGAADDRHTHSPRDLGAAEDHDLTMLERRVLRAEADVAELERTVSRLERKNEWLEEQLMAWGSRHAGLQQVTTELVQDFKRLHGIVAEALGMRGA